MSERVLTLALQSTVLLASAWIIVMLLRREIAAMRHHVWTLGLGLLLVLPFWPESRMIVTQIPVAAEVKRIVVRPNDAARVEVDWLKWLWIAGVALLAGRELLSQVLGEWLRRRARSTEAGYSLSEDLAVPAICGLWQPTVLLPVEAAKWETERLDAVAGA